MSSTLSHGVKSVGEGTERTLASALAMLALGAGIALLFAPMSGADMRRALLGRAGKQRPRAGAGSSPAEPPVREATPVALERDIGYGASHGYDATHGGPSGPGDAPASVVERAPEGKRPPTRQGSV